METGSHWTDTTIEEVFAAAAKLHRLGQEETRAAVVEAWRKRNGGAGVTPDQMPESADAFAGPEFTEISKADWLEMVEEAGSVDALMEQAGWEKNEGEGDKD